MNKFVFSSIFSDEVVQYVLQLGEFARAVAEGCPDSCNMIWVSAVVFSSILVSKRMEMNVG